MERRIKILLSFLTKPRFRERVEIDETNEAHQEALARYRALEEWEAFRQFRDFEPTPIIYLRFDGTDIIIDSFAHMKLYQSCKTIERLCNEQRDISERLATGAMKKNIHFVTLEEGS